MNFVAVNLEHDIVPAKRGVKDAREEYARLYKACNDGEHPPNTKGFQFDLPKGDTADPDVKTFKASG